MEWVVVVVWSDRPQKTQSKIKKTDQVRASLHWYYAKKFA